MHGQRNRRNGAPTKVRRVVRTGCIIDGCTMPHMALGYCNPHYNRVWRLGSPTDVECQSCGQPFARPLGRPGSRSYCPPCFADLTEPWRIRRRRQRAASANLTTADRRAAREYRALILDDPCVYCGGQTQSIDHIEPVLTGGSDRWDNLAPVCGSCNSSKGTRPILAFLLSRAA